ncbi:hypothetical protein J4466_02340 [Candidatus Pacearchaeota archaeon]|nr:hypothetical protein [Candidatus Pacearchaeota archaeon]
MIILNNKKADANFWVISLVLAIIALLFVVLWYSGTFGFISKFFKAAPLQDVESVAQGCVLAAQGNFYSDYCTTFKDAKVSDESTARRINCQYSGAQASISAKATPLTCSGDPVKDECARLRADPKFKGVKVNDLDCNPLLNNGKKCGADFDGSWQDTCTTGDVTLQVTDKTEVVQYKGKFCCVGSV